MKKTNFGAHLKDEIVSRFEAVVKNEIEEFNESKKDIDNHFRDVHFEIKLLKKDCDLNSAVLEECKTEIRSYFITQKQIFDEHTNSQIEYIRFLKQEVRNMLDEMKNLSSKIILRDEFEKHMFNMHYTINNININQHKSTTQCLNNIAESVFKINEAQKIENECTEESINKLNIKVENNISKINDYEININGYLKEFKVLNNSIFILEKKIEHIYNLLDRSKEGGLLVKSQ